MSPAQITIEEAIAAVQQAFTRFPDSRVSLQPAPRRPGSHADLTGSLLLASHRIPLEVTVRSQASSRVVAQLAGASGDREPISILVAPYVGPSVADAVRRAGIGYVDLAGNAFVHRGLLYLSVEGREPPSAPDRGVSLFSPKASRIVRVLLYEPEREWRQIEIADAVGVSAGYVSQIASELVETGLAERTDGKVGPSDPGHLLDLWAAQYELRRVSWGQWHIPVDELHEVAPRLSELAAEATAEIAFTGLRAASLIAAYGFGGVTHLFADEAVVGLLRRVGATRVASGGNLLVNVPPWDEGVFLGVREVGGVLIAHPVQLYLDTWALGGRGRESAQVLREQCLEF